MATAHPAKFPDAVEHAIGVRPALPEHLADLFEREERTETLPNDLAAVEDYVDRRRGRKSQGCRETLADVPAADSRYRGLLPGIPGNEARSTPCRWAI